MTLVKFLLARIAEDEAVAREAAGHPPIHSTRWQLSTVMVETIDGVTHRKPRGTVEARPARVLAECEAKRRIVERETERLTEQWRRRRDEHRQTFDEWLRPPYGETLRDLASVYADHPDYAPEWSVS